MTSLLRTQHESETLVCGSSTGTKLWLSESITSQCHQARDSKSPGASGTRASHQSRKKQDPLCYDYDEVPGKHHEWPAAQGMICVILVSRREVFVSVCSSRVTPPIPVAVLQATLPLPVPGLKDATQSVPVASPPDFPDLPDLTDLPDPQTS
ncbi:hypothetical protein P4O66_009963 [Electrophorus voltai]|uniref:Uncharacterized protein n=1 Tax=Electrophorus voltai TaxID=2609070 RepID=A0AAD8Z8E7_9TELE|nr:hypothetical protein P4O66_009963 [Electrophorus voltai]